MGKLFIHIFAFILMVSPQVFGRPAYCDEAKSLQYRGLTVRGENDSFANTDRNYSHGITVTVETHALKNPEDDCFPWPVRWHARLFNAITPDSLLGSDTENEKSVVMKFGQAIYTPANHFESDLIKNDRPYAGLLFAGLSLHRRYQPNAQIEAMEAKEITLGIIGPWSMAKEFQQLAHSLFGDVQFDGWNHQLRNEPAFQVSYDKKYRDYAGRTRVQSGFAADWIRSYGLRLGNIETSANIAVEGRIGFDIPNDFGSFTIRPGTDSRPPDVSSNRSDYPHAKFGYHFFTIVDLKYVAYNFSVDGNLYHHSHRVTRQPWVVLGAIGLSLPTIINHYGYNLAIMQVYQTSEFREQNADHAYQMLALSIDL